MYKSSILLVPRGVKTAILSLCLPNVQIDKYGFLVDFIDFF